MEGANDETPEGADKIQQQNNVIDYLSIELEKKMADIQREYEKQCEKERRKLEEALDYYEYKRKGDMERAQEEYQKQKQIADRQKMERLQEKQMVKQMQKMQITPKTVAAAPETVAASPPKEATTPVKRFPIALTLTPENSKNYKDEEDVTTVKYYLPEKDPIGAKNIVAGAHFFSRLNRLEYTFKGIVTNTSEVMKDDDGKKYRILTLDLDTPTLVDNIRVGEKVPKKAEAKAGRYGRDAARVAGVPDDEGNVMAGVIYGKHGLRFCDL